MIKKTTLVYLLVVTSESVLLTSNVKSFTLIATVHNIIIDDGFAYVRYLFRVTLYQ